MQGEPAERHDVSDPGLPGEHVNAEFEMVAHGEAHVPVPVPASGPVDERASGGVVPAPIGWWYLLPHGCCRGESLPWCAQCLADRRRAQACPWGALSLVERESRWD